MESIIKKIKETAHSFLIPKPRWNMINSCSCFSNNISTAYMVVHIALANITGIHNEISNNNTNELYSHIKST